MNPLKEGDKVVRDDGLKGKFSKARSCAESYYYVLTEDHEYDLYLDRWTKEENE